MSIWTQDLLKIKAFRIAIIIGIVMYAIIYFSDYNSVEKKCAREADQMGSMLKLRSMTKLQELQLDAAKKLLVEKCIQNGGK